MNCSELNPNFFYFIYIIDINWFLFHFSVFVSRRFYC